VTTYTESLRLWQGTPGDPAIRNAWGTALNTNETLLESAILDTAVVDIAGEATYILTTANGAPDQARTYIQSYTGALAANCTVTLPNVPKIGWTQNATTGGFSVIVTTGVGSTVTVPPDSTFYWYMVDTSGNVTFPTFTYGSLSTAGSLTVGGNMTVAGDATVAVLATELWNASPYAFAGIIGGTSGGFINNNANTIQNLGWDNSGNFTFRGSLTSAGNATVVILFTEFWNASPYAFAGIIGGTSGGFINNNADTIQNLGWDNSGNFTFRGTLTSAGDAVVVSNGGTYNISIAGNANSATTALTATSAGSASTVPWSGVSGIPSDISSINQALSTGANVTFNEISASYGYQVRAGISGPGGTDVFNIYWNGTNAQMWIDSTFLGNFAYLSDQRIKQNITDAPPGALDRVMQWRTKEYEHREIDLWKADGIRRLGFLADQLHAIDPRIVEGTPGELTSDGKIQPLRLNIAAMLAEVVDALLEIRSEVAAMKAR
jgi:hypothetical protein